MTEKPLFDRLRWQVGQTTGYKTDQLLTEAADEIEALQETAKAYFARMDNLLKEIGRLTRERDELLRGVNEDEGYEALKRDNERLTHLYKAESAEVIHLNGENERLRAALERIITVPPAPPHARVFSDREQLVKVHEIVRAALAGSDSVDLIDRAPRSES